MPSGSLRAHRSGSRFGTVTPLEGKVGLIDEQKPESGKALERLIFFSDAVFAIAMTLLVLDIPKPEAGDDVARFLTTSTIDKKFLAYVISFWVIALYWMAHHRLFRVVKRFDQGLVTLNLVLLFFVAFLPYPSAVLGETGTVGATIFYAICVSAVGAASTSLTWYAIIYRSFTRPLKRRMARFYVFRGLVVPIVFLSSIPVALVNQSVAQSMWTLTFILPFVVGKEMARRERREADEAA